MQRPSAPSSHHPLPGRHAGYLLGFALGGFFDGILLHQILQWHHLLSNVQRAPFDDVRVQLLADGVFHALMYAIAAAGLWQLARQRRVPDAAVRLPSLLPQLLLGFGVWHLVDTLLSHWLLGIHRIRIAEPGPLFWDLLWLGLFGLLPMVAGWLLRRRSLGAPRAAPLAVLVVAAALGAALPYNSSPTVTVLLRPDASPATLLAGLDQAGARVVGSLGKGEAWVLALAPGADPARLYAHGALYVSGTLLPAGCSAWIKG